MAKAKSDVIGAKTGPAATPSPKTRGPGRPQSGDSANMSRATILKTALKMAMTIPLQDLSIVTVSRAMSVTPALIHYYIGGRDWLTSGIMNLFYRNLLRKWPEETGDWKVDLLAAARVIYDHFSRYGGIAAYAVSNSRFRVFQLTAFGDRDYGVETLERFAARVRAAGLSGDRTGIYANQFIEFIISTGNGTSHHIYPAEHKRFLEEKIEGLDPDKYPNLFFTYRAPFTIDGAMAFQEGCYLFMLGIATEIAGGSPSNSLQAPAPKRARVRRSPHGKEAIATDKS